MSKTGWITLLVVSTCAAFALGVTIRWTTSEKTEAGSDRRKAKTVVGLAQDDRIPVFLAMRDKLRGELAEKQERIAWLESEVRQLRAKPPPPLTPEEEKKKKEEENRLKRAGRWQAIDEKSKDLRARILQRKDKALRAEGLQELFGLLQSDEPGELLLALSTLPNLPGIILEKESLKPRIVTALSHEDDEIRLDALNCILGVGTPREVLGEVLRMAGDPSPEVRYRVTDILSALFWGETGREVTSALRVLAEDDDKRIRDMALGALWERPEYTREIEDFAIELSRRATRVEEMTEWLSNRDTISDKVAQRLVEMYDDAERKQYSLEWTQAALSDGARPIVSRFCIQAVRESIEDWERRPALESLRSIGDTSVLSELEEIARSPDGEGIEKELAETIAVLRSKLEEQR